MESQSAKNRHHNCDAIWKEPAAADPYAGVPSTGPSEREEPKGKPGTHATATQRMSASRPNRAPRAQSAAAMALFPCALTSNSANGAVAVPTHTSFLAI